MQEIRVKRWVEAGKPVRSREGASHEVRERVKQSACGGCIDCRNGLSLMAGIAHQRENRAAMRNCARRPVIRLRTPASKENCNQGPRCQCC
jgi:hypothetical protein